MDFLFLLHSAEKKGETSLWSLATLEGFPAWASWIKSPQRIWFNLNFFFWSHQKGGHSPSRFSARGQNSWIHQLLQIRRVLKQPHTIVLPPPFDYWSDVLLMKCCVSFTADATGLKPSNSKIVWSSDTFEVWQKCKKLTTEIGLFFTAL